MTITAEELKSYPLLSEIPAEKLEFFVDKVELAQYDRDEIIFKEDQTAENVYLLSSGRVAIMIEVGKGKHIVVYTVLPGRSFAWSALVPPHRMTASAKCVEHAEVIKIPRTVFNDFSEKEPEYAFIIMEGISEMISKRLKDTRLQLINLVQWKD